MSWEKRILSDDELRPYQREKFQLHPRISALIAHQREHWPMLRDALAQWDEAQYKDLVVKGAEVIVQCNPRRIVSTAAKVDAATIRERPCFLCEENLPPEEKGVALGEDFVALCNPFPVLEDHLVIASRRHTPQSILGNFEAWLDLTKELGEGWFTLYNGPRCGASAPDHLHFQACSPELVPIFTDLETWEARRRKDSVMESFVLRDYRVNALLARSDSRQALIGWVENAVYWLAAITQTTYEPLINLVATFRRNGQWTLILYPRSRHRPSCYDAEGEAKLTVSPAAIDLSGMLVVPEPEHFARITAEEVERIYAEVTLENERFERWLVRINALSGGFCDPTPRHSRIDERSGRREL